LKFIILVGLVGVQVPPLRHGWEAHGFIKIAQVGPVYCGGHWHWNELPTIKQIPPYKHGFGSHTRISHRIPFKPTGHTHRKRLGPATWHVPSLKHGLA